MVVFETWIWYGVVTLMLGLRLTARFLLFKDIRKFQIEDWFMVLVFSFYTVLIVFLNICADVSTNLIPPDKINHLTAEETQDRVYGSKCVLVVESMMCAVQWGTKACMLMLYYRITENLRQRTAVQILSVYCLLAYLVMISLYYGYWCRPFSAFWQTPTPNIQCATQTHHLILNLVFNLSSDLMIILIPLPMFIKARLPLKKKLLLVFPFSLGFFTMVCAILSKHLSFTQPFSAEWIYWYTRESSTAMIVTNMPYSWTIVRKVFHVKSFLHHSGTGISQGGNVLHGRHLSATSQHTRTWPGNRPFSFWKRDTRPLGHAKSSESTGAINDTSQGMALTEWKATIDNVKNAPFSSTSSERGTSTTQRYSAQVDEIDRLYKLDDDDLIAQQQAIHGTRLYEP